MRENGHIAPKADVKKKVFKARWRNMVRWLDKHIRRVRERQKAAVLQPRDEIRHDVVVRPRRQSERNSGFIEALLQASNGSPDGRPIILVHTWQDMGGTGDALDALFHVSARHCQACLQIRCPIVDSWQYVAMKIEHRVSEMMTCPRCIGAAIQAILRNAKLFDFKMNEKANPTSCPSRCAFH